MTRRRAAVGAAVLLGLVLWQIAREREATPGAAEPGPAVEDRPGEAPASQGTSGERSGAETSRAITGRVVDPTGAPWVGLAVAGGERTTLTDTDGSFVLAGVDPLVRELELSSDFDPSEPLGERRLACAVAPVPVDLLAGEDSLHVGTHVVPRSRPFWVEVTVELEESWANSLGITLDDVKLTVRLPEPEELGHLLEAELTPQPDAAVDWNRPPWRRELPKIPRPTGDGSFRFALETPHDPFLLRVSLRRLEPTEWLVVPVPDGSFAKTLRMP